MPLRSYRATSPGRRFMTRSTFEEITTREPYKPLLEPLKRGNGRAARTRHHVLEGAGMLAGFQNHFRATQDSLRRELRRHVAR